MRTVVRIYQRAFVLTRDWPWLILVSVVAELAQHVAEIKLGMYSTGMSANGSGVRLGFGIVKIIAIFSTLIIAWRLWQFEGDLRRALMPSSKLFKGIGAFLLVQILGNLAALGVSRGLIAFADEPVRSTHIILTLIPLSAWLIISVALFPWYVAAAVEDQSMTLGRSLRASRGQLLATLGLMLSGTLPLMSMHYGLGYAAIYGAPVWPLMIIDALVVGLLTATIAATYYTIYIRTVRGTKTETELAVGN